MVVIEQSEPRKRKFKLEDNKVYTLRKLGNVELSVFQNLIEEQYQKYLNPSELKLIHEVNSLMVKRFCENYIYTDQDKAIITFSTRIISKVPIWIRKNIEIFEQAHELKSMWGENVPSNRRGQNFLFNSYA